jgi:uncharacterized protein (DUF488 family)
MKKALPRDSTASCTLYTVGCGLWPPDQRMRGLIDCLNGAGVRLLLDIRHSPCASQIDPCSNYGPRAWHLQSGGAGLAELLADAGIEYRWLVELGNPQKNDREMKVLKEQLAANDERWPVNRGLGLLQEILKANGPCALMCACADYRRCHRTVVADALRARFPSLNIEIAHLPGRGP